RSILQNQRRIAFIKCVQAWKQAIAENKTELWMNSAKNHPQTNKAGKTIILHGWNWFLHFNIYRTYNGLEPILDPPE
ncbi:hypothetical protein KAR91_60405, partial [Candidatus Pacearchaeota archaeon]|nr:hypothetical protein [Candidatus Pacearchaeota archaeon]